MVYDYRAVLKLSKKVGRPLTEKDVHLVKPMEGAKGKNLTVYGVCIVKNGVRYFMFYCADYGEDRFKPFATHEKSIKVRQNGDATLVGSHVIGW